MRGSSAEIRKTSSLPRAPLLCILLCMAAQAGRAWPTFLSHTPRSTQRSPRAWRATSKPRATPPGGTRTCCRTMGSSRETIRAEIAAAKAVIVIWAEHSVKSRWVYSEAAKATRTASSCGARRGARSAQGAHAVHVRQYHACERPRQNLRGSRTQADRSFETKQDSDS